MDVNDIRALVTLFSFNHRSTETWRAGRLIVQRGVPDDPAFS